MLVLSVFDTAPLLRTDDQIHTTGMDIKQAPNAKAVITVGKDTTFRDYAQGAYRMRGIGEGQTAHTWIPSI